MSFFNMSPMQMTQIKHSYCGYYTKYNIMSTTSVYNMLIAPQIMFS